MSNRLNEFTLSDGTKIARPVPINDDPWGILSPIKDTPWGKLIPVVDGESFSHAVHGYPLILMRVIGPPPYALMKKIPSNYRVCQQYEKCIIFDSKICHPCPKVPECYQPPNVEHPELIALVSKAWKEGRYVIIVIGEEFNING